MNNGAFHHKLLAIDFQNNNVSQIANNQSGLNLASTPTIKDLDNDGDLEIIYIVKKDSLNPSAWTGFYVNRLDLGINTPNIGVLLGMDILRIMMMGFTTLVLPFAELEA